MKIVLNPMFEQVSGHLGDVVFREVRGKTVASRKPATNGREPSSEQTEHRERFRQAVSYGKFAMADEGIREVYEQAALGKDMPVFALTVADFLNIPSIEAVDLTAYNGQEGNPIHITASDDFGITNVVVTLRNGTGDILEAGQADETASGSGRWIYAATASVPAGTDVNVQVAATDRPGSTAIQTANKSI